MAAKDIAELNIFLVDWTEVCVQRHLSTSVFYLGAVIWRQEVLLKLRRFWSPPVACWATLFPSINFIYYCEYGFPRHLTTRKSKFLEDRLPPSYLGIIQLGLCNPPVWVWSSAKKAVLMETSLWNIILSLFLPCYIAKIL